jgi:protein-S-isoprenylcysteine O-methyltransferase Ste14
VTRARIARRIAVFAFVLGAIGLSRPTPGGVLAGFLVAACGEALRLWAAGHLIKTDALVTSGPYRHTRNPLYLGRLLILTGLCVMARLPFGIHWVLLGLGYGVFFAYYLPRKERVEPARLRETHGEAYERYFRAVPALWPSLRGYGDGRGEAWSPRKMLRNREHWMVAGLLAATLFLFWRTR